VVGGESEAQEQRRIWVWKNFVEETGVMAMLARWVKRSRKT
jgi:hypothetical protein